MNMIVTAELLGNMWAEVINLVQFIGNLKVILNWDDMCTD